MGYLALSMRLPPPASAKSLGSAPSLLPCDIPAGGYLRGSLHATSDMHIDWSGPSLSCAGNARPGDAGLRLFFAGHPAGDANRLMLVIGLDARVGELAGREVPASVTLIDEATSEFFHANAGRCFSAVSSVQTLPDRHAAYRIEGHLYCAGALPAVSGLHSVTLGDIAYAGRLVLDAS
jgi:hypothetical protein